MKAYPYPVFYIIAVRMKIIEKKMTELLSSSYLLVIVSCLSLAGQRDQ